MIEERYRIDERNLLLLAEPYDWKLGLGIEVRVYEGDCHVGTIRLLCAEDEPKIDKLKKLEPETLVKRGLAGLLENKAGISLQKMDYWQNEIGKLGFNYVSPLYGNLAGCF